MIIHENLDNGDVHLILVRKFHRCYDSVLEKKVLALYQSFAGTL